MKDFIKYSLKLFLTFVASSIISFISMMLFLSAEIDFLYKILLGVMFIAFSLILVWNCSNKKGNDDFKAGKYKNLKGFFAGFAAMIPMIILEVVFISVAYLAWEKNNSAAYVGLYDILYLVFLCYSPMLSSFVSYNPAFGVDFAQPAITYLKNITTPNAVSAPMFLIPIIAFISVSGIAYLYGCKEQLKIKEVIKNIKKK